MNTRDIVSLFGASVSSQNVDSLFSSLNTLRRPELPEDEEFIFHDWVLIRRKGIELGFTDSEYQSAADRPLWGHGDLLLTQAYFYSGFDDIRPFTGQLPYDLNFQDTRDVARSKLSAFEATRHSHINDTWDVEGYRLSVTYKQDGSGIDRLACRVLAAPIPYQKETIYPSLEAIALNFGSVLRAPEFMNLWEPALDADALRDAKEDGEIDFTESYGATLGFARSSSGPVFRSITLHRNRDMESAGWRGPMPLSLDFEDSPEVLFNKIKEKPVQQSDSPLTGHAVWHFDDYTLHVLYSNLDNRLLRIKLIAPGTWRCIEEVEAG